jgi:hypothetical protein
MLSFFNHSNICLGANLGATSTAFAVIIITKEGIFFFAANTAFWTNQQTHPAGNAILLQKFRLYLNPPRASLVFSART